MKIEDVMDIRIDSHTLERAKERGINEEDIRDVMLTGTPIPAKHGRKEKAKIYMFGKTRHNKFYDQKKVEVFYSVEGNTIVTVTVYVFYGRWEN